MKTTPFRFDCDCAEEVGDGKNVDCKEDKMTTDTTTPAERSVHRCHWPDCDKPVPPRMWGCRDHWYRLPLSIRRKILSTYRRGQESDRKISREYIEAALEARNWALDAIRISRQP